ncbi:hypothetical protein [Zobellella sp. DQSA1]|uniref:hypothetical protein n=1 Tax=Zobellella sp. DQSA1 TaxID=3342386 RepID=UPI0035C130C5
MWRKTHWQSRIVDMMYPADVDRQIGGVGEVGMGGPTFWTLLLRDGAVVGSASAWPQDVAGGELRLIPARSREGTFFNVYEPAKRTLYTLGADARIDEAALAAGAADALARLRHACRHATAVTPLHPVHGLLVPLDLTEPAERLKRVLPSGRLLEACSCLPGDLRHADDPMALLAHPPYKVMLDGASTDRYVCDLDRVAESPSGDSFSLAGAQFDNGRIVDGLYHLWFAGTWFRLLSYSHKPEGGRGSDTTFFIEQVEPQDGGIFRITLDAYSYGPDGRAPRRPAPPVLALLVDWQEDPLLLPTEQNRVTLRLPNAAV